MSTEVLPLVSLVTGHEKNGVFINCDVQCAYMFAIHVVEELQTRVPAQSDRLFSVLPRHAEFDRLLRGTSNDLEVETV